MIQKGQQLSRVMSFPTVPKLFSRFVCIVCINKSQCSKTSSSQVCVLWLEPGQLNTISQDGTELVNVDRLLWFNWIVITLLKQLFFFDNSSLSYVYIDCFTNDQYFAFNKNKVVKFNLSKVECNVLFLVTYRLN